MPQVQHKQGKVYNSNLRLYMKSIFRVFLALFAGILTLATLNIILVALRRSTNSEVFSYKINIWIIGLVTILAVRKVYIITAPKFTNLKEPFRDVLNQLEFKFQSPQFHRVKRRMEFWIEKNPKKAQEVLDKKINLELWMNGQVANIAGDILEESDYSEQDSLQGIETRTELLRLFDKATDYSQAKGEFDEAFALKQKQTMRANLKKLI